MTPMVVTGSQVASLPYARGLATLTVRFPSQPVPLLISAALAAALAATGGLRLRLGRARSER